MSKQPLFSIVDFNAGLGGRTSIVTATGCPVVAAIENDPSQREIFQALNPQTPLLYSNQVGEVSSADIVMASNHNKKIAAALSLLTQFSLPEQVSPEKFIYDMLLELDGADEVTDCAKQITSVTDNHDWLGDIVLRMNRDRHIVLYQIVDQVSDSDRWAKYIDPIRSWLIQKQTALKLMPV